MGEAVEEGHLQGLAPRGGELLQQSAGALGEAVAPGLAGKIGGRSEGDRVNQIKGASAAQRGDGAVARQNGEPSAQTSPVRRKASWSAPQLQEDLVQHVFGRGRVAQNAQRHGVDDPGVAVEERGHGLLVARLHQRQQERVVRDGGQRCVEDPGLYLH